MQTTDRQVSGRQGQGWSQVRTLHRGPWRLAAQR